MYLVPLPQNQRELPVQFRPFLWAGLLVEPRLLANLVGDPISLLIAADPIRVEARPQLLIEFALANQTRGCPGVLYSEQRSWTYSCLDDFLTTDSPVIVSP